MLFVGCLVLVLGMAMMALQLIHFDVQIIGNALLKSYFINKLSLQFTIPTKNE